MSRYIYRDCESFRQKYLCRIDDALYSIDRNREEMDFENAVEKDKMEYELDTIKGALMSAKSELSYMVFE